MKSARLRHEGEKGESPRPDPERSQAILGIESRWRLDSCTLSLPTTPVTGKVRLDVTYGLC